MADLVCKGVPSKEFSNLWYSCVGILLYSNTNSIWLLTKSIHMLFIVDPQKDNAVAWALANFLYFAIQAGLRQLLSI